MDKRHNAACIGEEEGRRGKERLNNSPSEKVFLTLKYQDREEGGLKKTEGWLKKMTFMTYESLQTLQEMEREREKGKEGGRGGNGCGCFYLLIRCSAWSPDPAR